MHITIDYSGLDAEAKHAKALNDCRKWYGSKERFEEVLGIMRQLAADNIPEDALLLGLSFSGVEGFPAEAMIAEARRLNSK